LVNKNNQNLIGNGKYPNWKLVIRKLKIGNEKHPNWKLVTRKLEMGNGHGPSGPP
jgi:hypothetical protein